MWPWRFWISGDSEDVPPLVVQVSVSLVRQGVPPTASAPLQVSLPLSPRACVLQPLFKSLLNIVNTGAEHRRSPLHVSQCRFEEIGRLLQVVQPRFQIAGTVLLDFLGNTLIYNIGIR